MESLSAAVAHPSLSAVERDIASLVGSEQDLEAKQMRSVAVSILAILDSLGEVSCSLQRILCHTKCWGGISPPSLLPAPLARGVQGHPRRRKMRHGNRRGGVKMKEFEGATFTW